MDFVKGACYAAPVLRVPRPCSAPEGPPEPHDVCDLSPGCMAWRPQPCPPPPPTSQNPILAFFRAILSFLERLFGGGAPPEVCRFHEPDPPKEQANENAPVREQAPQQATPRDEGARPAAAERLGADPRAFQSLPESSRSLLESYPDDAAQADGG